MGEHSGLRDTWRLMLVWVARERMAVKKAQVVDLGWAGVGADAYCLSGVAAF